MLGFRENRHVQDPSASPSSFAERGLLGASGIAACGGHGQPSARAVAEPNEPPAVRPSIFNVRVPLPDGSVFLMNTLTDAQLCVTPDVVDLLDGVASGRVAPESLGAEARAAVETLAEHGFVTHGRGAERRALEERFEQFREDASDLRVTVLTTLQCNFACGYCVQGDHGEYNTTARKMSIDTASQVAAWVEEQLDAVRPRRFVLTFFGGEPLLNLPVVYFLAERLWAASKARGVAMVANVITNGLLLTPAVVDRLLPFGLKGVKVTLDGDREAHDRARPLRGGQGTFDRIIANLRDVAGRCAITIGGNVDERWLDRYPSLLAFLRAQEFAASVAKVSFKPVIRRPAATPVATGVIPLAAVDGSGAPLGGSCQSAAGPGGSPCDTCHFVDDHMAALREETRRQGFPTPDGVHMGPCELHRRHAHTIGPEGERYACPGFAGEAEFVIGDVTGPSSVAHARGARRFERIEPWRACGDCAFIPVCGGGCSVAAHHELGDMTAPACHKPAFESALISLAHEVAGPGETA